MRRLLLISILLVMVVSTAALATGESEVCPRPDPQNEQRLVERSRQDLLFESFELSVPPFGWTLMTSGQADTWVQTNQAYSGAYCAYLIPGGPGAWQDEWLITPAIETAGLTGILVEFMEVGYSWSEVGYAHELLVSTTVNDDPAAFTSVWRATPDDYDAPWLDAGPPEWGGPVIISLSDYIGETIYVALRYEGEEADYWLVDDFRVFEWFAHDLKAVGVLPDGQIWTAGEEITPRFTVQNWGAVGETFDAEMIITHNGAPFYSETVQVQDLGSGQEISVEFPPFVVEVGAYDLTGTAILASDDDPSTNVATATNACYSGQATRTPFGILYTNWGCAPCVAANQAADLWYPTQGNDAVLIRNHVYWPSPDDPMYQANIEECLFLLHMTPILVNGVPTLLMDNAWDSADAGVGWPERYAAAYAMSAATPTPLEMRINYDQEADVAHVSVDVIDIMPTGDYVVHLAITQDRIFAHGPNDEQFHHQAFRRLYPGVEGTPLVPEVGVQSFAIPVELADDWAYPNLRATTWVQEVYPGQDIQGAVLNAATMFLTEGVVAVDDDDLPRHQDRLAGAHPNPFNPMTTISFSLAREQQVRLSVFDMTGKRVAELFDGVLAAGEHPVVWNGKDRQGREVASGSYMIHMETEDSVHSSKMTLVR